MRLLANENFPILSIRKLSSAGFDVTSVAEIMRGAPDTTVLLHPAQEHQIILTFDKDYGELIYHRKIAIPKGLIYFKFDPLTASEPFELFIEAIINDQIEIEGWFLVLDRDVIRKRKLPSIANS
jgi:predicted nuclease of predicted toxin-antitoxin system